MREGIALLYGVQISFCCPLDTAFQATKAFKVLSFAITSSNCVCILLELEQSTVVKLPLLQLFYFMVIFYVYLFCFV